LERLAVEDVGIFHHHFVYLMAKWYIFLDIWYILWPFGVFFLVLVRCTDKNLATLHWTCIFWEKRLLKSRLISTLDKVIYFLPWWRGLAVSTSLILA
jgi:hypothetical protein